MFPRQYGGNRFELHSFSDKKVCPIFPLATSHRLHIFLNFDKAHEMIFLILSQKIMVNLGKHFFQFSQSTQPGDNSIKHILYQFRCRYLLFLVRP